MGPYKICRTCAQVKLRRQFYRHPSYADGRMSDCKACKRAYAREQHWLKRETILARKRVYNTTPAQRAARRRYAHTPRGREVMRESRRVYRTIQRMDRQQVAA